MIKIILFFMLIGSRYAIMRTIYNRISQFVNVYTSENAIYFRKMRIREKLKNREIVLHNAELEDQDLNIITVRGCMIIHSFANTIYTLYVMWEILYVVLSALWEIYFIYNNGLYYVDCFDFQDLIIVMVGLFGTMPFLILVVETMRKLERSLDRRFCENLYY